MPSNPPTVDDLLAEVSQRCGLLLDAAGLYVPDGLSVPIVMGLRRGCKAVYLTLANPLVLQDSDVANLTGFAIERVEDEAELFALEWLLSQWWRVARIHNQEAFSAAPVQGGWVREQEEAIRGHVSSLRERCREPYREPSAQLIVADPLASPSVLPPCGPLATWPFD